MKISRTIAYALNATLQLGKEPPGVPISCTQLAGVGELPKRFLLQILRRLVTQGVLMSSRGADGGYCLSRPPEEVTLRDIVEAFDPPSDKEVPSLPGLSPAVRARVHETLQDVAEVCRTELGKLSVAELLRADG
jgi:Rrf2 family protein